MFPLRTEQLILRHFQSRDKKAMLRVFGDREVMRFGDGIQTDEWVQNWLQTCIHEHYPAWGFGPYAVLERGSQMPIGYCGLFSLANVDGQAEIEIGYRLALSFWGKGYASEAARAVRDYAFSSLNSND